MELPFTIAVDNRRRLANCTSTHTQTEITAQRATYSPPLHPGRTTLHLKPAHALRCPAGAQQRGLSSGRAARPTRC